MEDERSKLEQELKEKKEELERIQGHAAAEIIANPTATVATKVTQRVLEKLETDETTSKKLDKAAQDITEKAIASTTETAEAEKTKAHTVNKEADFESNKEEYLHHGIDYKVEPWKSWIMLRMNDIWFVIFSIVCFFTIVPFSMFMSRIKALNGILKFVAIATGVIMLLAMLGGATYLTLKLCGVIKQ